MQKIDKKMLRIIDANINRTKEGLRVCEDICRFVLNSHKLTAEFKKIRHELISALRLLGISTRELLKQRDIKRDVGKKTLGLELVRRSVSDIFWANAQRIKESTRVLEEFSKLYHKRVAGLFKLIRYHIYHLEKKVIGKLR